MPTWLYHFTHIQNLPGILEAGALVSDRECAERGLTDHSIAYPEIKARRRSTVVEAGPRGTLDHYVPLYFGPRSPMLLTYKSGNVTGKAEDQSEIVYLVTTAERVVEAGLRFAFSDGHPIVEPRAFFDNLADLAEVDLPLMREKFWCDTDDDNDRKRRRQAEFLVHSQLPLGLVQGVGVLTPAVAATVGRLLNDRGLEIPCHAVPTWYYCKGGVSGD